MIASLGVMTSLIIEVLMVFVTSSTNSNSPIDIASKVCRKRGRIILIGTWNFNK